MSRSLASFFLLLVLSSVAFAESETGQTPPSFLQVALDAQQEADSYPVEEEESNLPERLHEEICLSLQATADKIDRFFGDERIEDEATYTRLRLSLTSSLEEGMDSEFDINLNGKVVFPRISRRVQLIISGDEDDQLTDENEEQGSIASRYLFKDTDKYRINFDAGFRGGIKNARFFSKLEYRYRRVYAPWLIRFKPKILWDTNDGWQANALMDVERKISDTVYLRSRTLPGWYENTEGYLLNQDFSYFIKLGNRQYLAFEWLNRFVTEPDVQLDLSRLRTRYRRPIWQEKLFLEGGAGFRFEEEFDYEAQAEAYLQLEMVFEAGKK